MIPLRYNGDGEFKTASHYWSRFLDKSLVIGEVLTWEQVEARSTESHKHYFAAINEAWANLPETLDLEFPTPEHLRKYALIKAGYCTMRKIACRTNQDAIALVSYTADIDAYIICEISGNLVTVYRAASQSMKAMKKKEFQESKEKVLHVISNLVGFDVTDKSSEKPVDGQTEVKGTEAGAAAETPAQPQEAKAEEVPETVITPELIATNLIKSIAGHTDKLRLEEWQHDNQETINSLPKDLFPNVNKALALKHEELATP